MNGEKVIAIAKREIGVTEVPFNTNKTKYGQWFGLNGVAWCGIFVSWCFDKAGFPLGNIGFSKGFAGCQTAYDHFKKSGEITTNPQPGDIVLFDWNGDKRYDHVGIFVSWKAKGQSFCTVEGNTSPTNASNGGCVMDMTRTMSNNQIFIHPKVLG